MILGQLTDPHIKEAGRLAYKVADTAVMLEQAIAHLNAFEPRVDAVIVTGDLTDLGRVGEYDLLRKLLDKLEMPWFPVPGNHDQRDNFLSCFGDLPALKKCDEFIQYSVDEFPVRMIGLDTLESGKPYGHMCPERLQWLDNALGEQPDKSTLLFLHHPPFKVGIKHMDVQNLLNGADLFECLKSHKQVKHIACGHVHRAVETCINGIGVSIAPNAAHSVALDLLPDGPPAFDLEPAGVRIFHIGEDQQIVSHVDYVGEFGGPYPFFDSQGRLID
jgi:3',5'-cyclic-AMP phosphodiesterase